MSIMIVQTENQIGLPCKQYSAEVASRLIEEQFAALSGLATVTNDQKAHFFAVAGDLFGSTRV